MMASAEVKPGTGPDETNSSEERRPAGAGQGQNPRAEIATGLAPSRATGSEIRWWDFFRVPHA